MQFVSPARPSVSRTLRALEGALLRRGRRTALRNAWTAVQEDQARAQVRAEAERALKAVTEGARPTVLPSSRS